MADNLNLANSGAGRRPVIDMRSEAGDRDELRLLVERVFEKAGGRRLTMVEIGSYQGESMEVFASTGRLSRIICVDPWAGMYDENDAASSTDMAEAERRFDARAEAARSRCEILKHKGTVDTLVESELGKLAAGVDFVYIDGMHTYGGCRHDVEVAKERIKPRVAFTGHDYSASWPGVRSAVDETLGTPDAVYAFSSWLKFVDVPRQEQVKPQTVKAGGKSKAEEKVLDLADCPGAKVTRVDYAEALKTAFPLGNMSLARLQNGNWLASIRQFNYAYAHESSVQCVMLGTAPGAAGRLKGRAYYFAELDPSFGFVRGLRFSGPVAEALLPRMEDIRLSPLGGDSFRASGTYLYDDAVGVAAFEFDVVGAGLWNARNARTFRSDSGQEKNWMPVEGTGEFIRNVGDGEVDMFDLAAASGRKVACRGAAALRGSTQCVPYGGGWLCACHEAARSAVPAGWAGWFSDGAAMPIMRYAFRLCRFSRDFSECRVSRPFTLHGRPITFSCGLDVGQDGTATMPVTARDSDTYVVQARVQSLLRWCGVPDRKPQKRRPAKAR